MDLNRSGEELSQESGITSSLFPGPLVSDLSKTVHLPGYFGRVETWFEHM